MRRVMGTCKDPKEDTRYPYAFMELEKRLLYHDSLFIVKLRLWDKAHPSNKY